MSVDGTQQASQVVCDLCSETERMAFIIGLHTGMQFAWEVTEPTQTTVKSWLKQLPVTETLLDGKSYFYIDNGLPAGSLPVCLFLAGFDQLMLGYEKT